MPAGFDGNFAGLESIIGALEGMEDMTESIGIESSIAIEQAIDSQFTLGVDPYGEPWAPLAESTKRRHKREDPPLTATGAMRSSVVVQATQGFIGVTIADPAGYHQSGTDHMPARRIVPTDTQGMPPAWEAAVRDAAMLVMERAWDSAPHDGSAREGGLP